MHRMDTMRHCLSEDEKSSEALCIFDGGEFKEAPLRTACRGSTTACVGIHDTFIHGSVSKPSELTQIFSWYPTTVGILR